MKSKPTIVWDADDTLNEFVNPVLRVIKELFNRDIPEADLWALWIHRIFNKEEQALLFPHIFCGNFYAMLKPTAVLTKWRDSVQMMALRERFAFQLITARQLSLGDQALHVTGTWMREKQFHLDGITISHPGDSKMDVAPRNTKAVVDDSPGVARDALEAGCTVFLIDAPWNKNVPHHQNLYRVDHDNVVPTMASVLLT